MTRLTVSLIILALLAPLAAAAPDATIPDETAAPALPDLAPAAAAVGKATTAAATATGAALAAIGAGIATAFLAAGHALANLASALGAAIAALGRALVSAVTAIAGAVGALFSLLASLGFAGARTAAAHPKESAIVAGSASSISLAAWAAKKWWLSIFVPLYSRLARSDMLENRVRAAVYEHVKQNPGAHPSRIAAAVGIGWGTIVYHLARLEDSSLVTSRTAHNRKCYFAVGSDLDGAGRTAIAAMATDKARLIVESVRSQPGLSQKALAEDVGISQALASWHVKRLVASGVLLSSRVGRSNVLHVAEHVPMTAPSAPANAAFA